MNIERALVQMREKNSTEETGTVNLNDILMKHDWWKTREHMSRHENAWAIVDEREKKMLTNTHQDIVQHLKVTQCLEG